MRARNYHMTSTQIALFKKKEIRKTLHNGEWWFAIVDVVGALTDSVQPEGYIKDMRRRDAELSKGWVQIATPLSIQTGGGMQRINCANAEGIFRIVQSIPSPKAEPFKRWLARVGYERVREIENPEMATKRTRIELSSPRRRGSRYHWLCMLKNEILKMNQYEIIFCLYSCE